MQPTSFQVPEMRDSNDKIIKQGVYGKKTPLTNKQNTGIIDYINNNLLAQQSAIESLQEIVGQGGIGGGTGSEGLQNQINALQANKTDLGHTHTASDITDFSTEVKKVKVNNAGVSDKLSVSAGSLIQPVYIKNGVPTAISYTLEKSVPADAKFTDTVTTVTTTGTGNAITSISAVKGAITVEKGKTFLTSADFGNKADKSTTLAGYGITNAYTKTETDNNFIKNTQTFSNWNPFGNLGNKKLYIDTLDNIFWGLNKRYFVTVTLHDRNVNGVEYPYIKDGASIADDEYFIDSPISQTYGQVTVNTLFDGSYEGGIQVPYGKYLKIHIQFSNEENWKPSTTKSSFPGYPYGDYYFTHYYNGGSEKIQVRTYQTHTSWAIGWHLDEASIFYKSGTTPLNSSNEIWKLTADGYYTRNCIEIIVYGRDNTNATSPVSTSSKTQLAEILYFGSRATMDKTPVFVKGQTQKLYDVLQIGDQTNNNVTLNPNGSVTATTITEGGQTLATKYTNKIETIKVNGTALPISAKSVNVDLSGKQDSMTEVTNEEILAIFNS